MHNWIEDQITQREKQVEDKIGHWNIEGLNSKLLVAARLQNYSWNENAVFDMTKTDDKEFFEKIMGQFDPKWKWKILSDWTIWHNLVEKAESDIKYCKVKYENLKIYVETCLKEFKRYLTKKGIEHQVLNISVSSEIQK